MVSTHNTETQGGESAGPRRTAVYVFFLGVLLPAFIAFARWFDIALENTRFGEELMRSPTEFLTDITLQVTALVIALSTGALGAIWFRERRRGRRFTWIGYFIAAALTLLSANLYVLFGLHPS